MVSMQLVFGPNVNMQLAFCAEKKSSLQQLSLQQQHISRQKKNHSSWMHFFTFSQVETAPWYLVLLHCGYLGRCCLHLPARTQDSFKGCLCNVGGSLWLVPINAQQLTGQTQDRIHQPLHQVDQQIDYIQQMDRLMDTYTSFVKTVLFQQLTEFSSS